MSSNLIIDRVEVRGYRYTARKFFESAHSRGAPPRQDINKVNFLFLLQGHSAGGSRSWGLGEGTPRGISGDGGDPRIRQEFLIACAEKLLGRKMDVGSSAAAVTSVRNTLIELFELAADFVPQRPRPFRGTLAGIEAGLLDLASRHLNMQISDLLGRRRDQVSVSTVSLSLGSSGEERSNAINRISKRFDGWRLKADGELPRHLETLEGLAREDGDKFIWLDFNQTLSDEDAYQFLSKLRAAHDAAPISNLIIIEQPVLKTDLKELVGLQELADTYRAAKLDVVIMADEAVSDIDDWDRLRSVGRVGAVNIKVQKAGGLLPSLDLANKIFEDDPDTCVYVGNMLNYSDLTRWQVVEFAKSIPRLDYFTTSPAGSPLDFCSVRLEWSSGAALKNKPKVRRAEDYVDWSAFEKAETFRRIFAMGPTRSLNPGKSVRPSKVKSKMAPAVITSRNESVGEIPKYWGRNVFSNALFEASALSRGANTVRSSDKLFFAETGTQRMSVYAQTPMETDPKNLAYTRSKALAKFLFERDGIRTPKGRSFSSTQKRAAVKYASEIGFPVVLKPDSGHGGHGVVLSIRCEKELTAHLERLTGRSRFLIESELQGNDHRFLVMGRETIAVWRRIPANVIGTGGKTVKQLVDEKNAEKKFTFSRLRLSDSIDFLKAQGTSPDSVLEEGRRVFLNDKENLTQGGDAIQMLDSVHPTYFAIAERIAAATPNFTHLAVDLMIEDVGKPATDSSWAVLETNSRPDILGGQYPDSGVALPLSDVIFEGYARSRLTLRPAIVGPITVELKLHFQPGRSKFDTVLEKVAATVPLEIVDRSLRGPECATAIVTGTAPHLAMLSTYMFHPEVEVGHNMCELIHHN